MPLNTRCRLWERCKPSWELPRSSWIAGLDKTLAWSTRAHVLTQYMGKDSNMESYVWIFPHILYNNRSLGGSTLLTCNLKLNISELDYLILEMCGLGLIQGITYLDEREVQPTAECFNSGLDTFNLICRMTQLLQRIIHIQYQFLLLKGHVALRSGFWHVTHTWFHLVKNI